MIRTLLLLVAACGGDQVQAIQGEAADTGEARDTTPPVIEHTPIDGSQPYMVDVAIEATITDDESGVFVAEVHYKRVDSTEWRSTGLQLVDPGTGLYQGAIPGEDVQSSGMDYYLYAVDYEGNEATDPPEGESDPYHFRIDGDAGR